MLTPEQFYDDLAPDYDAMTQFDARLEKQKSVLENVLGRLPATQVVDMGCGTGVHAVALAQLGCAVTGVDLSAGMLARAQAHADRLGATVRFVHGDFLAPLAGEAADLLLCLGNSIPHLPSRAALAAVLAHWRGLLAPAGHVLLQLLNYRRVLSARERIVNIHREDSRTIVRFYDFLDDALQFNILTIDTGTPPGHSLRSTRLQPFTDRDLVEAGQTAGFASVGVYGGLDFRPFDTEQTDCVLVATT